MKVTLDRFGRVLIPKRLRDRLGLAPGDTLELVVEDNRLLLVPKRGPAPLKQKGRALVVASEGRGDLTKVLESVREERLQELTE